MNQYSRILLISNSTVHGRGYLDHVQEQIKMFLGDARKALFFPFALYDRDDYAAKASAAARRRRTGLAARWVDFIETLQWSTGM